MSETRKKNSRSARTTLAVVGLGALGSLGLSACSSGGGSSVAADCTPAHADLRTVAKGSLTFGVIDAPPFTANVTGGGAEGLDVDIVKELAKRECLDVRYVSTTIASGIPMISQQKSVDLMGGALYAVAKRAQVVDFVGPLYYDKMSIASRTGVGTISGLESLGSVGTVDGMMWIPQLKEVLGDKLRTYPSSVELSQDLLNGRLDAAIDSYATSVYYYKSDQGITVTISEPDERVAVTTETPQTIFPISKDATGLRDALNEDAVAMRTDGTLKGILRGRNFDEALSVPPEEQLRIIDLG